MNFLDLTRATAAENLALDEALLDAAEQDGAGEVLRFWDARGWFVVVGYANQVATEVDAAACARDGVPVLRRCSGGGTVLQGPGCLNYALVLDSARDPALHAVADTNRHVMGRHRRALERLLGCPVIHDGHTDLALPGRAEPGPSPSPSPTPSGPPLRRRGGSPALVPSTGGVPSEARRGGLNLPARPEPGPAATDRALSRKFSGNSQRRRRRFLLFHGTFLLGLDLDRVARYLPLPSREPGYRQHRSHREFLVNLPLEAAAVREALAHAWDATSPLPQVPDQRVATLVRDQYATDAWNRKF